MATKKIREVTHGDIGKRAVFHDADGDITRGTLTSVHFFVDSVALQIGNNSVSLRGAETLDQLIEIDDPE